MAWNVGQADIPYGQLRQEELTASLREKADSKNSVSQLGVVAPFEE